MAIKIYTKTGDKGETSLFGGARLPKNHVRIEAYGTVDELNAHIGYLFELISDAQSRDTLETIQNKLFNIGSVLATDPGKDFDLPGVTEKDVHLLETAIDTMETGLPELKQFVLPSGHAEGAYAHVCRTVCRRAERRVVHLAQDEDVDVAIVTYLNRLSDYLFVLARHLIRLHGGEETTWDTSR